MLTPLFLSFEGNDMASSQRTQQKWLRGVIKQLNSMEGVSTDVSQKGHIRLEITYFDKTKIVRMSNTPSAPSAQKAMYRDLRRTMTSLGIEEQVKFRHAMMNRSATDDEWQLVWREIRKAEKSLSRGEIKKDINDLLDMEDD